MSEIETLRDIMFTLHGIQGALIVIASLVGWIAVQVWQGWRKS